MSESAVKHAEKHTKDREINPFKLHVKLSDEMREQFEKVLTAVRSSPHIDKDVLDMAGNLAAGKQDLVSALNTVRFLSEDIDKHHRAEGGVAGALWDDFVTRMSAAYEPTPPFTLVDEERRRGRV